MHRWRFGSPRSVFPTWSVDETGTVGEVPLNRQLGDQPTETIGMIPLGCARLRMACLPVAAP